MAFALGLAVVYMADRLPSAPYVELPTAVSTDVFPVFIDKSLRFTREQNCGLDPTDPQARLDCVNQRLLMDRDQSLYTRYEITCDAETSDYEYAVCGKQEIRQKRSIVWRHWKEKSRAHLIVRYVGNGWSHKAHYFVEPSDGTSWQLSSTEEIPLSRFIDGERTPITFVEPHWNYKQARWKTSTPDDGPYPYDLAPGTRYLEFENETGDTVSF